MTGPAQIIKAEGADDRLIQALGPIQAFLEAKQKKDHEQQQLLIQKGYLSLQQEQFKAGTEQRNQEKKSLEDMSAQISKAIAEGQNPDEDLKNLGGLMGQALQSGNTKALKDAMDIVSGEQIRGIEAERAKRMSEYRTAIAKATTPDERQSVIDQASFDFPQYAGAFSQLGMTKGGNMDPLSDAGVAQRIKLAKGLRDAGVTSHGRPPTEFEGKSASAATRMLEAAVVLQQLEETTPGIGQSVDAKIRAAAAAAKAGAIGGAAEPFAIGAAIASMTAEEQLYLDNVTELVNARVRRESGQAVNLYEYDREGRPLIMNAGQADDPRVLTAKQRRRIQGAMLYAKQGGEAFDPSLLSEGALSVYTTYGKKPKAKAAGAERATPFDEDPWSAP